MDFPQSSVPFLLLRDERCVYSFSSPFLKLKTWLVVTVRCATVARINARSQFHKENVFLMKWRQIITNNHAVLIDR